MCKPVFDETIVLKDNAMLRHRPDLFNEWNFEKNDELGLNIYKVSHGSGKRAWWICNVCSSNYKAIIHNKINGGGCSYCSGRKVNHTNSLQSLNPKLSSEWHPIKNGDFTPNDVTMGNPKKIWWICNQEHVWNAPIYSRKAGSGCPFCSGRNATEENNLLVRHPEIAIEWHSIKNKRKPETFLPKSNKKVWWICELGHEWEAVINNRVAKKSGCPYCAKYYTSKIKKGYNDMWTNNPELASLLLNPEDGYEYSFGSNVKVDWKCKDCGNIIKDRRIADIYKQGLPCEKCNDNLSYGERILYFLLRQLNIYNLFDRKLEWSQKRKYDFILKEHNTIIEVHGSQHYTESNRGRSLSYEQENDILKYNLAIDNGIKNYIVIDAQKSDFEHIKSNILSSELANILDLSNVDWNDIRLNSSKSVLYIVCDAYLNNDYSIDELSNYLHLGKSAVKSNLKTGFEIGLCERKTKDKNLFITTKTPIIQLDRDLNFVKKWDSVNDATMSLIGKSCGKISAACKDKKKIIAGFRWLYESDYHSYIDGELELEKSHVPVKEIVQLDLDSNFIRVWISMGEAKRHFNMSSSSGISSCCHKKRDAMGGFKWMFKEDYDKLKTS